MFKVYKRIGDTFAKGRELIGTFATFEEAHSFAQEKVCKDICHEGLPTRVYWMSDEGGPSSYKVCIDADNVLD